MVAEHPFEICERRYHFESTSWQTDSGNIINPLKEQD
jgi:hypothetical protein